MPPSLPPTLTVPSISGTPSTGTPSSSIASTPGLSSPPSGLPMGKPSSQAGRMEQVTSGRLRPEKRSRPIVITTDQSKPYPGRLIAHLSHREATIAPSRSGPPSQGNRQPAIPTIAPGYVPSPGPLLAIASPPPPIKRCISGNHYELSLIFEKHE